MKAKLLFIICIIGLSFGITHPVSVFVNSPEGKPVGDNRYMAKKESESDICKLRRDGLFYAVWMTDVSKKEQSAVFYPGDGDWGFEYYSSDLDYEFGLLSFSLQNFKAQGRRAAMPFDFGDSLHIRLLYETEKNTYIWSLDSCIAEPPYGSDGGFDIDGIVEPIDDYKKKESFREYKCFK